MEFLIIFMAVLLSCNATAQNFDIVITLATDETSNLTSPNYPAVYDNNIDTVWQLLAPKGHRIRLHFTDFYTERNRDVVFIYDGMTRSFDAAEIVARLSGDSVPRNRTSLSSSMWLRFTSDMNNTFMGFRAIASTIAIPVVNLSAEETSSLISPNYPDNHNHIVDIVWQVTAPSGSRVMVQFIDSNLREFYDVLNIYHGLTDSFENAALRASLSQSSSPNIVASIGSYVWIQYIQIVRRFSGDRVGFSVLLSAVKPDWACDFQSDTCGLNIIAGSWSRGEENMYYYIQAAGEEEDSFAIPRVFTSHEGMLSFGFDVEFFDSLSVSVCKSQEPSLFEHTFQTVQDVVYTSIQYSCDGIQDIEIIFTTTGSILSQVVRVLDIQLFETSISSTVRPNSGKPNTVTSEGEISTQIVYTTLSGLPTSTTAIHVQKSTKGSIETGSHLVPILISALVSLVTINIFVVLLYVVFRRKRRLEHTTSQGSNAAFGDADTNHRIRDNPVFERSDDLPLPFDATERLGEGNGPYLSLTSSSTSGVYQTLNQVNSRSNEYPQPINGFNGPDNGRFLQDLQVNPATDYENAHEYEDPTNNIDGINSPLYEGPINEFLVNSETTNGITHEYMNPANSVAVVNSPQYESPMNDFPDTNYGIIHEYHN